MLVEARPTARCTCPDGWDPQHNYDHDFNCDLWNHDGFTDGKCGWDPDDEILVWFTDYPNDREFEELNPCVQCGCASSPSLLDVKGVCSICRAMNEENGGPRRIGDVMRDIMRDIDRMLDGEELDEQAIVEADIDAEIDYVCTCTLPGEPEPVAHRGDCELWLCDAWINFYAEWDHGEFELVWSDLDEDGNPVGWKQWTVTTPEGSTATSTSADVWDDWHYSSYTSVCRHYERVVEFPDGTQVLASSKFSREKNEAPPDFALYLDDSWPVTSIATYLPWRDFGLPTVPFLKAAGVIVETFETAASGLVVEVGCIGGHGRTGTVLACMAVLAGVPAVEAVAWVKKNYCQKAVETTEQKWFVLWFDAWLRDVPAPPRPPSWSSMPTIGSAKTEKKEEGEKKNDGHVVKSNAPLAQAIPCPLCGAAGDNSSYICNQAKCKGFTITRGSPRAKDLFAQVAAKHEAAAKSVSAAPHPAHAEVSVPPSSSNRKNERRGKRKGWKNLSGGR